MNAHELLRFETTATRQHRDITEDVRGVVQRSGLSEGLCHVMVMHSTAAVVVNETADPNVGTDIASALERAVPDRAGWLHDRIDDNASAHIQAALLGPSECVPVRSADLVLGTWQRIILMEFDGPQTRQVHVQLLPA